MLILYLAVLIIALGFALKLVFFPDPQKADDNILKTEKLERMLAEKNKNIQSLQEELKVIQAKSQDFDKLKSFLEEEIQHLKEQNRILKPEKGEAV
jgi:uncharacterized protein YoxC